MLHVVGKVAKADTAKFHKFAGATGFAHAG